ncbi:hypothetical protein A3740_19635 [Oleiphilus sp. HI0068]|uniref:hypothetical protein n=1 Tax=unclassified Oleiphilus TaxID=2631174 RepID=UPI0007C24860|nr:MULTISPECIES: hypothetical protein [unclassified Oleiphilus]KZY73189.1 hypothetical protein A3740_19635 [Oleiphilus sp. HI0068]KZY81004.1 hypothetical protein A3741_18070 [Oleiphilus sp. HI0069]KZZ30536.1 hypothetical protein A3755_13780 [Oleiphilus sp. HI0085]
MFNEKLALADILPKEGRAYPLVFDKNEENVTSGDANILWLPPHSELNGLDDGRPSEILKAHIIQGNLSLFNSAKCEWLFKVVHTVPLISLIESQKQSGETDKELKVGTSYLEQSQKIFKSVLGKYILLHCCIGEASCDLLYSIVGNVYSAHFLSLVMPLGFDAKAGSYVLNKKEVEVLNCAIDSAQEIKESSLVGIGDHEVYGVESF